MIFSGGVIGTSSNSGRTTLKQGPRRLIAHPGKEDSKTTLSPRDPEP